MKDDESISNGFIIFALKSEEGENMDGNGYQLASGTIVGVQEMRFRLITDDGKGLLLTLGHNSPVSANDLMRWHKSNTRVVVVFNGEPNYQSTVVQSVRHT